MQQRSQYFLFEETLSRKEKPIIWGEQEWLWLTP